MEPFDRTFQSFHEGLSPLAHIDSFSFFGSVGQAGEMCADVLTNPPFLQQSPGLADLTNGNQLGAVTELIRHILDQPTATSTTYGVGTSKLFKISPTTVISGGSPSWPQTISGMTEGECVIRLKENLFVLYNKAAGGDIAAMPLSTEVIDPDWGSTVEGGLALEKTKHPAAVKEDIMLFGNGRYVGAYIAGDGTLDTQKLDFGEGSEVVDIVFTANLWWIAVNYADGRRGQIYLYDPSATSNTLSDEAGIGNQSIGFLFVHNGNVFVAYEDKTATGFIIGWVSGRSLKPLRYFNGSLPDHRQKTLYYNAILFVSGGALMSAGAAVEQLPIQISKHALAGYATVGALAAPFGTPMVASSQGSNYRLAKFSGYSQDSYWKSLSVQVSEGRRLGMVQSAIVETYPLEEGASCKISFEADFGDEDNTSDSYEITGEGKFRFLLQSINLKACSNVRVHVDFSESGTTKKCPIRSITLLGHRTEA